MDTTDVSFQQAYAKKVKVLMYTGLADDGVSPYNTIQFYDRLVGDLGQKKVDKFLRFYTVPRIQHGFGPFTASFDSLTVLRAWVEDGVEPGSADGRRHQRRDGGPHASALRVPDVAAVRRG